MRESVRFGICGLGFGAGRARLISKTKGAELICVCDLQEEKAKRVGEELSCEWTTVYDEMLRREDIDVVGVYTPSGMHAQHAIEAVKAGKHVFVAKPMDIRVDRCDELIDTAKEANVILAVDFGNRYNDVNQKVKLVVDNNRIGKVILADLRYKNYRTQEYYDGGYPQGWRSRRETEGGSAANQGVHSIDLYQWFLSANCGSVRTVYGMSGALAHKIETEDVSMALLTFESGAWGTIVTTTASIPPLGRKMEIHGDKGSIVWDGREAKLYCKYDSEVSLDEFELPPNRPKNIIEDMISAITKGTSVMCDGVEGRKSVAIFNAIYESSQTGRVVELDYL